MTYSYTIKWPSNGGIESIQITGDFDNWSQSLPKMIAPPFDQKITVPTKKDIVFKFIINDGNWTTSDAFATISDENGFLNNVIFANDLRDDGPDELEDTQVLLPSSTASVESHKESEIGSPKKSEPLQKASKSNVSDSSPDQAHEPKSSSEPPVNQSKNQDTEHKGNSSASSFAAVSSPPVSSDYEKIPPDPTIAKPTLLQQPSDSTIEESSGTVTPKMKETPRIPGHFPLDANITTNSSQVKREGLFSKFKSFFRP